MIRDSLPTRDPLISHLHPRASGLSLRQVRRVFTGSRNQGENILGDIAPLTTLTSPITAALHVQLHRLRAHACGPCSLRRGRCGQVEPGFCLFL